MRWTFRIVRVSFAAALIGGIAFVMRPRPVDVDVAKVRAPLDQKVVDEGRARVRDGQAVARAVAAGHRGALQTEAIHGLEPEEVLIIHPGASVHEGAKVASR